jgi:UDP-N-acetylglucosamine:LPS N-acetylglucosamine transferase
MTMPRKTVDLIYFNAGGGHRAAALALEAALAEAAPEFAVRRVHLFEVLDPQGQFKRITGMAPEAYYNKRLARGWTLGLAQELKLLQGMIRIGHGALVRALEQHWLRTEPDMVVSLVPNFNRALYQSLAAALPGVPYVTVLTDFADYPPHFWIEPGQRQDLVCGTPRAVEQALAAGYAPDRVHAVSGMLLRPDFYRLPRCDRSEARRAAGLDPGRPTGLVMFGGHGSAAMVTIARALEDVQLILVCGHNEALGRRLRGIEASAPRAVLGFTPDMPRYMQMADFFIGKPGPGSLSEAVQMRLPVIVAHNAWTMPQERYNTRWVQENGVGMVLRSFRQIRPAVGVLLEDLERYRAATEKLENRAVFEVAERLRLIARREDAVQARQRQAGAGTGAARAIAGPLPESAGG